MALGKIAAGAGGTVLAAAGGLRWYAGRQAARRNGVVAAPPYLVPDRARQVHAGLDVVDLHADSLLWRRDLRRRSSEGHLDLPRLREAGVALQVFAAVTQIPAGLNFEQNTAGRDLITLLAVAQGWPPRTWTSRLERARYTARRLHRLAEAEAGRLRLITSATDLEDVMAARRHDPGIVGALLAVEGTQALDDRVENLDVLFADGYRLIGLQHFFDNRAGGSAHGVDQGGLTPFGTELVRRIQDRQMVVDLAHSSPQVVSDVLDLTTAPIVVSHTGLRGTCDNQRNLSDHQVRRIAATGGLIGIAMFARAVGGNTVDDTARALRYGADLVGVDYFALGTDFDGAITTSTDVTGLPLLTAALLNHGFTEVEIHAIMGGNALRVLRQALPA